MVFFVLVFSPFLSLRSALLQVRNEFALFVISMRKHVDFANEQNGLNDSDLLIEAFPFEIV